MRRGGDTFPERLIEMDEREGGEAVEKYGVSGPVVEITGNRRVVVDGCDGIVDYSGQLVILRAGRLVLHLSGRDLRLVKLTESSAVVEGFLQQVEYGFGER